MRRGDYCVRYHGYLISKNHDLLDAVVFAYDDCIVSGWKCGEQSLQRDPNRHERNLYVEALMEGGFDSSSYSEKTGLELSALTLKAENYPKIKRSLSQHESKPERLSQPLKELRDLDETWTLVYASARKNYLVQGLKCRTAAHRTMTGADTTHCYHYAYSMRSCGIAGLKRKCNLLAFSTIT